ncbi:two-component system response regulator [Novimethylophilus kurashikiensis]|uniref:Two-component system response regulator n=1 Tax=Novimethylophilus kurashikiensis TaxID=1825523 RepID=A0A2R5F9J8_9PROT|nr:two-component system response regulator [Novimethylophilus kurashikiensis]
MGLNAAMALSHLRVQADPVAVPQFKELLGPDWVVYQTGHTLGLEKGGLKLVFCDLLDESQGFADAPLHLIDERKSLGLKVDY